MRKLVVFVALVAIFTILIALPASASSSEARVMFRGDSITHGAVGDVTFRQRVHVFLQSKGVNVLAVGPINGPFDPKTNNFDSPNGYQSPHASRWGGSRTFPTYGMNSFHLTQSFSPNIIVDNLGTNDLLMWKVSPEDLIESVRDDIRWARLANPDIDFILPELFPNWREEISRYNKLLWSVEDMSTEKSQVVVTQTAVADSATDTYDGIHPNEKGEAKMSASVTAGFVKLGIVSGQMTSSSEIIKKTSKKKDLIVVKVVVKKTKKKVITRYYNKSGILIKKKIKKIKKKKRLK